MTTDTIKKAEPVPILKQFEALALGNQGNAEEAYRLRDCMAAMATDIEAMRQESLETAKRELARAASYEKMLAFLHGKPLPEPPQPAQPAPLAPSILSVRDGEMPFKKRKSGFFAGLVSRPRAA